MIYEGKTVLVLGGNGFIGHHIARRFREHGAWVRTVDINPYEYGEINYTDEYLIADLRDPMLYEDIFTIKCIDYNQFQKTSGKRKFDYVVHTAAWMGGAGVIFTGDYDAQVLHDNLLIDTYVAQACIDYNVGKVFYASSACCYNQDNQTDPENIKISEDTAYPANPDSDYGFEKLMGERIFLAYHRNHNLDIRIGRFHNVYGPEGSYNNGKEKAPAAMCRKVAEVEDGGEIEIWGDGKQTRSFLYIEDCVDGVLNFFESDFIGPVNIGSEEMVSINELADIVSTVADKSISYKHIDGPLGVRGRTSDNHLMRVRIGWAPRVSLHLGISKTYNWINSRIKD